MKMEPVLLHRVYRAVGIGTILLGLFACSEEPTQQREEAKQGINEATVQSEEVKVEATVPNEQAKAELLSAMKEARAELEKSQVLLSTAPEGKDSDASLEALKKDLHSAETVLSEARKTIDQGNYSEAKEQLQEITDTANHVNQQIRQANRKLQNEN